MKTIKISDHLVCRECNIKYDTLRNRNKCIYSHNLTLVEYAIKHYFDSDAPKCECGCGKRVCIKFVGDEIRYSAYTKNHFPRKPHDEETRELIKRRTKEVIQERHGVDNVFQLKEFQERIKKTNLERYGVENPAQNEEIKQKFWHAQTEKTREKIKATNQERYGANSYTASKTGKEAVRTANLQRYGVENPMQLGETKLRVQTTNMNRTGYPNQFSDPEYRRLYNTKISKAERLLCETLGGEPQFRYEGRTFDIRYDKYLIEVDGEFWHPDCLENLTLAQVQSAVNDRYKEQLVNDSGEYQLVKIRNRNVGGDMNIGDVLDNAYKPEWIIKHKTPVIRADYFKNYIQKYDKLKLKRHVPLLLRFIRTFQVEFPYPPKEESATDIITKISKYDLQKLYTDGGFNGNSSNVGVEYLKSHFRSYWKSRYKGGMSPVEAWRSDRKMTEIIKYRMGINESDEVFDFSMHQILRGMSARRYTVSFFKPVLAAAIYEQLLGDKKAPTVFDPCAGFGGRLLGFKSRYPDGKYIGIEPNVDTYNELKELVNDAGFTNVELHNCKIEDFDDVINYDIAFTSIPYWNLEKYSNNVKYYDFGHWQRTFIQKILEYKNFYINLPQKLYDKIGLQNEVWYHINNNTSHFDRSKSKKSELIIKN